MLPPIMAKGSAAAGDIVQKIQRAYPKATYALDWKTPFELLVGAILAAQSTDVTVNRVTPRLFAKYKDARGFAKAKPEELEEEIRPCGIHQAKTRSIIGASAMLLEKFGGQVPKTMEEMLELPGVKRKTANVVLNCGYGIASGIIVDTHVERLAQRIGLSTNDSPEAIETDLMQLVPQSEWTTFGPALILHGRQVCNAKAPKCEACLLSENCVKAGLPGGAPAPVPAEGAKPKKKRGASAGAAADGGKPVKESAIVSMGDVKPWSGPLPSLPGGWQEPLGSDMESEWFRTLWAFVKAERESGQVFPSEDEVFSAFEHAPYSKVKLVILGQDPYHDDGQAHGLCFSVKRGVAIPPSLRNMYKELETDLRIGAPSHGNLEAWAKQGALLLNAVLTVRAHTPNSHKDRGWERFTDAVIDALNRSPKPVVFALWGAYAQKKGKRIDASKHVVVTGAHPSPLSAKQFMGSKPFSAIDAALKKAGHSAMNWKL
jgi:uracil-DNA glycosylase